MTMEKAKVDILLTYWGEFSLLKKTVESVLAQTYGNWQLLVFDDCYPTDEAKKYFKELKDPRVVYHRHKKNIGITNNFNFALQAASADYCVMIGCDDMMLPNYLDMAISHIGEADFYQPGVEIINKNDHVYLPLADRIKRFLQPKKSGLLAGEKLAASLCVGNWLYFPSIMWKTVTIKKYKFDTRYKIVEDLVLELNIIKDGGKLFYDKNTTFQYRRFAESLSSREKSKDGIRFKEEEEVYSRFNEEFKGMRWNIAAISAKMRLTSRIHKHIS